MKRRTLARLARIAWASPCSLVGLIVAAPMLALGAAARRHAGTLEIVLRDRGDALGRMVRRVPIRAIALGHVILGASAAELDRWRAHERVDVRQYERWGIALFVAYAASSLWQWLLGRRAYWDNRFEVEARCASHDCSMPR